MKKIEQRVYKTLAGLLETSNNIVINVDLVLDDIPKMDSLFFLEVVSALEKEFEFKFNLEDVIDVKKVGDFVAIIKDHIKDEL